MWVRQSPRERENRRQCVCKVVHGEGLLYCPIKTRISELTFLLPFFPIVCATRSAILMVFFRRNDKWFRQAIARVTFNKNPFQIRNGCRMPESSRVARTTRTKRPLLC